jgi:GNAT superfamily N-acetyltransferase
MTDSATDIPAELRLTLDDAPSMETRGVLGREIDAYHARTVPRDAQRFALLVDDENNRLVAGLSGVLGWQWLFVEALWVSDAWRSRGIGRALLAQAEARAVAGGCHSAWLDTFQARGFYLALGYRQFGALDDYPPGQARHFLCKRLA